MNGADVVAEILKREGTEFLACYPRNPLIDACAKLDIRPILCRQERMGVGMADGFSRIRAGRQNGVFAAQHGPGIENAFAGVAQAYAENVPVLVIPAGFGADRQHIKPTFRAAEVYAPVTKYSVMASSVQELPHVMRRAYQAMRSGKPGPVLVEVPNPVFDATFEGTIDYKAVPVMRSAPDPASVKEAVKLLLAAKNPVIWAGQGVHYAQAGEKLAALAEMIPAPVCATNPGKSAIAENHPLSLGASTRSSQKGYYEFLNRADIVLAIGSSMTRTSFGPALPTGKRIIHSTNDASDINKDLPAELGLVGDAGLVIDALMEEIGRQKQGAHAAKFNALKDEVAAIKKAWLEEWSKFLNSDEVPINQYRVVHEMLRTLDRDNVIITHDAGSPREQLLPFWETTRPHHYMGWGKSTQLGYGLGLAMGAKLASPKKMCINVMGDSSFGMSGMDIETASRNGIAILTVVFNNQVMACERHVLETSTAKFGALNVGGNYSKVAEGLNVAARRVEKPAEIAPALKEAVKTTDSGKPFLLEIVAKEGYDFSRYARGGGE
jgi:acetolactate synthase-1/2/3 large subunit